MTDGPFFNPSLRAEQINSETETYILRFLSTQGGGDFRTSARISIEAAEGYFVPLRNWMHLWSNCRK